MANRQHRARQTTRSPEDNAASGQVEELVLSHLSLAPNDMRALHSAISGYLSYLLRLPGCNQDTALVLKSLQRRLAGLLIHTEQLKNTPIMLSQTEVAIMRESLLGFCILLPMFARDTPDICAELVAGLMHLYERLGAMQRNQL
jgi:hypothetical protein